MRKLNDAKLGFTVVADSSEDVSDAAIHRLNMALAKRIYELLQHFYPGHPWGVEVGHESNYGLINVRLMGISNWSATTHISKVNSWPALKAWVKKGPGELLERFRLPREGFSVNDWNDALHRWKPVFNMNRRPPD